MTATTHWVRRAGGQFTKELHFRIYVTAILQTVAESSIKLALLETHWLRQH